jgi:hypothetical protein
LQSCGDHVLIRSRWPRVKWTEFSETTAATIHKLETIIPVIQPRVDIRKTLMDKELGSKLNYFEILQLLVEQPTGMRARTSRSTSTIRNSKASKSAKPSGGARPRSPSSNGQTAPRFPSVFPRLRYTGPASAHRAQSSNAALPSVGEVTFVGSTITLPRSGYMLGMAVQPEKVNEVCAEPSSS